MKKILISLLTLVLLAGCSEKEVARTFELIDDQGDMKITYLETYTAKGDVITKGTTIATIAFNESDEESIEYFKTTMDDQVACPYGVEDENGSITVGCSKYVDVDYTYDEGTKTFIMNEVLHFDEAAKNKEDIYSAEAGGTYSENEYYSMEMFESDLLSGGYVEVKK